MGKKAFEKIAEGLSESLAIARGEAKPARLHSPPKVPNAKTRAAMKEIERGNLQRFNTVESLMADLNVRRAPKREAHRQSLAVAKSRRAKTDQAFIDAVSELGDEGKRTWNYRVMEFQEAGETRLEIRAVHYEGKRPRAYADGGAIVMSLDGKKGLRWELDRMLKALEKPVLKTEDFKG